MTNFILLSPLDQFEVISYFSFNAPIFGYLNFTLTNFAFYSILLLSIFWGLHYFGDNDSKIVPNGWSLFFEASFASLISIVRAQIGSLNEIYLPFIYSLFFFILIGNLISNIPYTFAVNTSAILTLGFSLTIFIGVTILAVTKHKIKFFAFFIPEGTPLYLVPLLVSIETISYFARAVSLGVRLFSNITAGHTLLKILSTFLYKLATSNIFIAILTLIPFALFLGIVALELMVSGIQAFVFTLLVASYLKDAIYLH